MSGDFIEDMVDPDTLELAPLAEYPIASYSEEDLAWLIWIAAREQRYACCDAVDNMSNYLAGVRENVQGQIQNAPCPDVQDVLRKWREAR